MLDLSESETFFRDGIFIGAGNGWIVLEAVLICRHICRYLIFVSLVLAEVTMAVIRRLWRANAMLSSRMQGLMTSVRQLTVKVGVW